MQRGKGKDGVRIDGGREVAHEVVGDEGDEEAALADASVADQEYLEGVTAANARPRGGTHHRPKSKQRKAMIDHQNNNGSLDLPSYFYLHFSNVRFDTSLLAEILNLSHEAGRSVIDLYRWIVRYRSFTPSDASLSLVVHFLARHKDFKAIDSLLSEFRRTVGPLAFRASLERLARAGRHTQALRFFDAAPTELGIQRDAAALSSLVSTLVEHEFPGHAEGAVKQYATEVFPDEGICNALIRGWCNTGKLEEARRLMAEKILLEMEASGIPRDAETFRVLISNLCKIRMTEDAMKTFRRMSEWGWSPDAETYLALIRSLYQAARVSVGDEMVGWMRSTGFGDQLDRKAYYGFVKILCGIERVEHAMKVFRMMKGYGHAPGVKTYSLLIEKLATHNQGDRANALFKEAVARRVPVTPRCIRLTRVM
ncbi:hypothetical protein ZIOFF_021868 [Zingiber officinale]|uniref:Pentatricopeptide repeat-containing protein n=1 Tax=Zingiber officinale TaxID=94328 RepID=A0A8J5H4D6_ZINOF|nr:hypothetical protein ZIOFF_021868 [Zingiber officinale]